MKQYHVPQGTPAILLKDGPRLVTYQTRKATTFTPGEVIVDPTGDISGSPEGKNAGVHGPESPTLGGVRARSGFFGFALKGEQGWKSPVLLVDQDLVQTQEVSDV